MLVNVYTDTNTQESEARLHDIGRACGCGCHGSLVKGVEDNCEFCPCSKGQVKLTNEVIDFNEAHDDKQSVIYQDDE